MIHRYWLSLYKYFYIRNDSSTLIEFVWIFLYQKWFIDIDWVCINMNFLYQKWFIDIDWVCINIFFYISINIFISEMIHQHWLSLYEYFYIRNDSSTLIDFCINILISEMIHRHWLSLYKYCYIRNDSSTLIEFV
jgi:hypothetical protein